MKSFLLAAGGALVLAAALVIGVLFDRERSVPGGAEAMVHAPRPAAPGNPLPVLWDAPAFSFVDQNGHRFTDRELEDRVWIGDFMFTSCTSICPMMTARMAELQRAIPSRKVHFVSFSVDPDRDSPEVLRVYAKMWRADESRWHFLATDRKGLAETAKAMKTFVRPPEPDGSIEHSGIFTLTDGKGRVRGVYDSGDAGALRQLARDAAALAGDAPATAAPIAETAWTLPESGTEDSRTGRALYASAGCAACHSQARVAPGLEGRFGSRVQLEGGGDALFEEAYVRESILDPNAKVVAGYPRMMPTYRGQLSETQVDQLVAYVLSLPVPPGVATRETVAGSVAPAEVVDPVCGMAVSPGAGTATAAYGGRTYSFCSPTCQGRFLAAPERYAKR